MNTEALRRLLEEDPIRELARLTMERITQLHEENTRASQEQYYKDLAEHRKRFQLVLLAIEWMGSLDEWRRNMTTQLSAIYEGQDYDFWDERVLAKRSIKGNNTLEDIIRARASTPKWSNYQRDYKKWPEKILDEIAALERGKPLPINLEEPKRIWKRRHIKYLLGQ